MTERRNLLLILGLDLLLLAFFVAAPRLTGLMLSSMPPCPFLSMGIPCPSCGGTRCVAALASGDIRAAIQYNAFFVLLAAYIAAAVLLLNLAYVFRLSWAKRPAKALVHNKAIFVFLGLYVVYGFARILLG